MTTISLFCPFLNCQTVSNKYRDLSLQDLSLQYKTVWKVYSSCKTYLLHKETQFEFTLKKGKANYNIRPHLHPELFCFKLLSCQM